MELIKIKDDRKALYMDLLLIADEDVRMIENISLAARCLPCVMTT